MKIPTGLYPFLFWICFGTLALVGPHIFVKSAGPEADRKRKLIRICGGVLVVAMAITGAGFLLTQE